MKMCRDIEKVQSDKFGFGEYYKTPETNVKDSYQGLFKVRVVSLPPINKMKDRLKDKNMGGELKEMLISIFMNCHLL